MNFIRDLWCQTFHWAHRQLIGFGSFYRGDEKVYGSRRRCRLCGREWVVPEGE